MKLLLLRSQKANTFSRPTFEAAMGDFFSAIWQSHALSDATVYALARD